MSNLDKSLLCLLRDFDYDVQGNTIIQKGIHGFTSDRVYGRCRSIFDAAEKLCPIIRQDEYTNRLIKLTGVNNA